MDLSAGCKLYNSANQHGPIRRMQAAPLIFSSVSSPPSLKLFLARDSQERARKSLIGRQDGFAFLCEKAMRNIRSVV